MKKFLDNNFLLQNKTAEKLYFDYAEKMPIIDYHCHLPVKDIAEDRQFNDITEAWLEGDHYKWRALRANGIPEEFITGQNSTQKEKFEKWAETVPYTLRNPLYHWTHLELKRYFEISTILNKETAGEIFEEANNKLNQQEYSCRGLLKKMNVEVLCTTDDPIDSLEHHQKIREDNFDIKVLPAFRPDKAMAIENIPVYNSYLDQLAEVAGTAILSMEDLLSVLKKRHQYFNDRGCKISDHGIETFYAEDYSEKEISDIFSNVRSEKEASPMEIRKFKTAMLFEFGKMDFEAGWVQQYHYGAIRNNNSLMFNKLGPDTGYDSISDEPVAKNMGQFLNSLATKNKLAKTIIYNLNPADNELVSTMIGNFQDGTV
ncbi:MAG: glucuronate isomerase, partial [Bacteroidales bacterium]|nr:glucuronate isomerase [Bacteroidales bacterium]